jgi:hypothetical protein
VERFHRQLKASLIARLTNPAWADELPWVLLGIRTTCKEDLGTSPAEMVYGAPLSVPGAFLGVPSTDPDSSTFLQQLRAKVGDLAPTPTSTHGRNIKPHVPQRLDSSDYVFVRRDGYNSPLNPKYDGPFKVIHRTPKFFRLQLGDRQDNVSIDRLKPAYTDKSQPVQVARPPKRGRPRKNNGKEGVTTPEDPNTTRSGRAVKTPQRYQSALLGGAV